ncbi:MAG: hypothetical protein IPL61_13695 [Myxococcales bacterium]|nr:hypothetical protein [Myxococcales bacterium]
MLFMTFSTAELPVAPSTTPSVIVVGTVHAGASGVSPPPLSMRRASITEGPPSSPPQAATDIVARIKASVEVKRIGGN